MLHRRGDQALALSCLPSRGTALVGNRYVLISGCSGGGKSTLLDELGRRGYRTVEEPGRRIVREELAGTGLALPWVDGAAFARRAIEVALVDRQTVAGMTGWVFFDRGLVDAASALQHLTGDPGAMNVCRAHRYAPRVFLTPPWPEIYVTDPERRHGLDQALEEYGRLVEVFPALGYQVSELPKVSVTERADFVLDTLDRHGPDGKMQANDRLANAGRVPTSNGTQ